MNYLVFWLVLSVSFLLYELSSRIIINRNEGGADLPNSNAVSQIPLDVSKIEPKLKRSEMKILNTEYDAHVKLCSEQYGNWVKAIKNESDIHMPDFNGTFLNVNNGLRVTVDANDSALQRLFVFGGSTVFCGEVPDNLTFCSQLQNRINKHNLSLSVFNYGRHGSTFKNRMTYLERCNFRRGDLVLVWFGVNELGWKLLEGKTNLSFLQKIFFKSSEGLKFVSQYFISFRILSDLYQKFLFPVFEFMAYFETKKSLKKLDSLSNSLSFQYRIVLQPNLFTKSLKSAREEYLLGNLLGKAKGRVINRLFEANYPRFRSLLAKYNGHDASNILDFAVREVFVDWVHLNSEGNRLVAEFLFEKFCLDKSFDSRSFNLS